MRSQKLMKKRYKRERGGGAERRRHMTLYELISLRDMIVINTAISRDGRVEHLHAVVWDAWRRILFFGPGVHACACPTRVHALTLGVPTDHACSAPMQVIMMLAISTVLLSSMMRTWRMRHMWIKGQGLYFERLCGQEV